MISPNSHFFAIVSFGLCKRWGVVSVCFFCSVITWTFLGRRVNSPCFLFLLLFLVSTLLDIFLPCFDFFYFVYLLFHPVLGAFSSICVFLILVTGLGAANKLERRSGSKRVEHITKREETNVCFLLYTMVEKTKLQVIRV